MPELASDPAAVIRACVERLSDETVHGVVEGMVRGVVQGIADEVAERAIGVIMRQLAALSVEPVEPEESALEPGPVPVADVGEPTEVPRESVKRCEVCGREGSRRFVETATGWRCSPTATACPGNRQDAPPASDIPAKPFPLKPTPPPPMPRGVTARCQDCTRAWNLTGAQLEAVVATHERANGHIVDIIGETI